MTIQVTSYKPAPGWSQYDTATGLHTFRLRCGVFELPTAIKDAHAVSWRWVPWPWAATFFSLLGRQNDYLFPHAGTEHLLHPFSKPHWWKTRLGFHTAWAVAKIIHGEGSA